MRFQIIWVTFIVSATFNLILSQDKVEPELPTNKEVLEKIKNLKSNEACFLSKPTIIENMGDFAKGWHNMKEFGPEGRDYSLKMVWMPDRKRAFFCGANHQTPHRINDAWEYDLASNTWVMLYTPDFNDVTPMPEYAKDVLVFKEGWLRTINGGPGHPAHTWSGISYDPNQKAIVWLCFWPNYRLEQKLNLFNKKESDLFKGPKVWMFYTQTKKWEPLETAAPWPKEKYGYSLEYSPELKKLVYHYADTINILDATNKTWNIKNNTGEPYIMETILCHDSKRNQFIAHFGPREGQSVRTTTIAKIENGECKPFTKVFEGENAPVGYDHLSFMHYDSNSGDVFNFESKTGKFWRFNPDQKQWKEITASGETIKPNQLNSRLIGYFDSSQNVFVVLGRGWVWCYRP